MKKINKIKIKLNGRISTISNNLTLLTYIKKLKIPLNKVAIELNHEIIDKNKLNKIKIKKMIKLKLFILLAEVRS